MTKVNSFFRDRIANFNTADSKEGRLLVKRAIYLSSLGIASEDVFQRFIVGKNHCRKLRVNLSDHDLCFIATSSSDNDEVLYKIVKSQLGESSIRKVAYPNPGLSADSIQEEVNLGHWLDIVRRIYVDCRSGKRTKNNALKFYSNTLPKEERENFLNWMRYYMSGDNLKYSKKEDVYMKKESVFQSDLGQGSNPYAHDGSGFYFQNRNLGNNIPGDSFHSSEGLRLKENEAEDGATRKSPGSDKSDRRRKLKRDLHAACRRIDKVIREEGFCSEEEYLEIAKLLLELSTVIKKVKLASTMNDLTHRYAKKIEKIGHKRYADGLIKMAQEVMPPEQAPAPPVAAGEPNPVEEAGAAPEAAEAEPDGPSQQEVESGVSVPEPDDVTPAKLRDIEPIPGPKDGEYEALAGNINLEDAAKKLDEVAGMLADRRIIRQLAEFDIMLDKIGIASMFPELAESQSKLIDAFSYALTRVTKMMGQLSNAKSLLEAGEGRGVPGATDLGASEESETPVEEESEAPPEEI